MDTFFDLQYNLLMVQNIINDSVVVESFISGESSLQVMSFRRGVAKQKRVDANTVAVKPSVFM